MIIEVLIAKFLSGNNILCDRLAFIFLIAS